MPFTIEEVDHLNWFRSTQNSPSPAADISSKFPMPTTWEAHPCGILRILTEEDFPVRQVVREAGTCTPHPPHTRPPVLMAASYNSVPAATAKGVPPAPLHPMQGETAMLQVCGYQVTSCPAWAGCRPHYWPQPGGGRACPLPLKSQSLGKQPWHHMEQDFPNRPWLLLRS